MKVEHQKCHLGKYVVGGTNISGAYNGGAQFTAFLECKYIIGLSLENIEILNHLGRMVFLQ